MKDKEVIVFDNLRQRSGVVGEEYESVKVKSFTASNAKGVLREVKNRDEIETLAKSAASKTRAMIGSAS